MRKKGGDTGPD